MIRSILVLSMALMALPAFGDDWRRGSYGGYNNGAGVVDRTLSDLRRAASGRQYLSSSERRHIDHALDNLSRFQSDSMRSKFDRSRLDSAISDIDHILRSNRTGFRERDLLARDVAALRDLRAGRGVPNGRW